jgi:hypothetical protein
MGRCEGRVAGSAWPARFTGNAKIVSVSGIHHPVAVDTKNSSAGDSADRWSYGHTWTSGEPRAILHVPYGGISGSDRRVVRATRMTQVRRSHARPANSRLLHLAKCNDDHFPYRLPQQCFGDDSDVPRIFILNFTSTSGPHAQAEYLVFDMEDFKAHEKAVVLVSTKEVVQPSLNGLLLDLLQFKLVHLAKTMITKLKPTPPKNSFAVLPAYQ